MNISPDKTFGTCEYCGSTMTLPKIDDEQRADAFNRGNHFRRIGEFDKALSVYEHIVEENPNDAEAHWCCALCRFGIEWVEDPVTMEYLPTCHRASFDIFTKDVDYLAAVELSDGITQKQYKKDAAKISEVQKGILATSQSEKPFDVFICYKESDESGSRTIDSTLAQDIYYQLTDQGLRVFFARITLEDKIGSEYEPYIFAALNSAKVMIVVGTKPEYFNAVWVKNEWSRFLSIVKHDRSKAILPCYKDMDPYDLPEQLSVLQSYDMSKIGFIQDLVRGINKVVSAGKKEAKTETVVINDNTNASPLLKRAFMFLEDKNWREADEYCEKVLDLDPENAEAYLGKLMAELQASKQEDLADCEESFEQNNNYQKAVRFGDGKLKKALTGYAGKIRDRKTEKLYCGAVENMQHANSENDFKLLAKQFESFSDYKDSKSLAEQCLENAEDCRKNSVYICGKEQMLGSVAISNYEAAIKTFEGISGWKDADEKIAICQEKIREIKKQEEAARLEKERQAEQIRIAAEKTAKKRKKIIKITTQILCVCIAVAVLIITVIIPTIKKNKFISEYGQKAYDMFGVVEKGSTVKFGKYEQDNYDGNGAEEIEWQVLDIKDGKALIISRYALDRQPYNTDGVATTWGNCSLRSWLNSTFLGMAFSEEEQALIPDSTVYAHANPQHSTDPGNDTTDKIFLLSINEAEEYFSSDSERQCEPTDYAVANGAYKGANGFCWWWLRSPGCSQKYAAYVRLAGEIHEVGETVYIGHAVRPAMWIDLSAKQ